ncbi:MAG: RNA methyltransferase [Bdellovibrionaceae bacterium]|nr:RNA methyltransferase [Pseudobdellovibrionaceae bacterium]MDW8189512.1 RNA methyltransferase [Pseudobdellovibrionaceae bacterium]
MVKNRSRQDHQLRMVVGHHAIRESMVTFPRGAQRLWLRKNFQTVSELRELAQLAQKIGIIVEEKSVDLLQQKAPAHQGAILWQALEPAFPSDDQLQTLTSAMLLILDGIEDPHNLGAILRTSWLLGVSGVYIPIHHAVGVTPAVTKVASGGTEHVPVQRLGEFGSQIDRLKKMGYWVYGFDAVARHDLFKVAFHPKSVFCFGGEDRGLRRTTQKMCDELVRIPQVQKDASYNVSVAVAIALSEWFRQHRCS